jgi:hypothetical protein
MIGGCGCGMCGVVYRIPAVALPLAPMDASGDMKLALSGTTKVGGMVEIGMGSDV